MAGTSLIFVHGDNFLSKAIQFATGSQWAHVGIELLGGIVEALFDGVSLSVNNKYEGYIHEYVEVDIPYLEAAEEKARALLNASYGFITDNVSGAVHDLTGIVLAGNGEATVNCSETVVLILRAGGFVILPDHAADTITPGGLYRAIKY